MSAEQTAYDEVLYPSGTFDHTHPNRLATLASLFGMRPAPVERCRVLELGCGSGGNLLPMAASLPDSTFVGIDLAARPIAEGQAWAGRLGLRNITLLHRDILDFEPEPGSYDYIIAHGVYSWVPPAVKDKLLATLRRGLAEQGVGIVSYNTLPGWYLRMPLRDMMLFHTRVAPDAREKVAQARAIASFIAVGAHVSTGAYKGVMEGQRNRISRLSDEHLFHDDLGEHNEPVYFHQFMEHAFRHDLRYLAEAVYAEMQDQVFAPEIRATLRSAGDIIAYEQYLDFLCGRAFRRTLLVREDVTLERTLDGARARQFFVTTKATPLSAEPDVRSDAVERFESPSGLVVGLTSPIAKAAMLILSRHAPLALSFDELLAAVRDLLGPGRPAPEEPEDKELGEMLLAAYGGDMVQLHKARPRMVKTPGERPVVPMLSRMQARAGLNVTDRWHHNLKIDDPLGRGLVGLLDGTRDRAAIAASLASAILAGEVKLRDEAAPLEPESLRRYIDERLPGMLEECGRLSLLEG